MSTTYNLAERFTVTEKSSKLYFSLESEDAFVDTCHTDSMTPEEAVKIATRIIEVATYQGWRPHQDCPVINSPSSDSKPTVVEKEETVYEERPWYKVTVKSLEEIKSTLNKDGVTDGLRFMEEKMGIFCGLNHGLLGSHLNSNYVSLYGWFWSKRWLKIELFVTEKPV